MIGPGVGHAGDKGILDTTYQPTQQSSVRRGSSFVREGSSGDVPIKFGSFRLSKLKPSYDSLLLFTNILNMLASVLLSHL